MFAQSFEFLECAFAVIAILTLGFPRYSSSEEVYFFSAVRHCYYTRAAIFNQCAPEFLKQAVHGYLIRGPDLSSLRMLNEKLTATKTTIVVHCE